MSYCAVCGTEIKSNFCPKCGSPAAGFYPGPELRNKYAQYNPNANPYASNYAYTRDMHYPVSNKSRMVAFILCLVIGCIGAHHFYVGRIGYGILYLFTGGLFGIGWLVDVILLATGSYKDQYGLFVSDWNA